MKLPCVFDTFDDNPEIKDLRKYLKKSCWYCSDEQFSLIFSLMCFLQKDFSKIGFPIILSRNNWLNIK